MRTVAVSLVVIFVVCALGLIGAQDYEYEKQQHDLYCSRVAAGVWPDYLGTFKAECVPSTETEK